MSLIQLLKKVTRFMKNDVEEKQKSEKEKLEEQLYKLLITNKESVVVSIKGSWGIGKSYFWHKFAKRFEEKKYAYISLFGKTSLNDIKKDIICQISSSAKILEKAKGILGSSNYLGVDISSALTLFSKSDFENITICFDDFERVSKEVDIKDVIGLISELKEQKECKIVIINNVDQLEDADKLNDKRIIKISKKEKSSIEVPKYSISTTNNKESFELFSEKIIDFTFTYSPSIQENYLLLKNKLEFFDKDLVLMFLEATNTNDKIHKNFNIRILKKYINTLKTFSFLSEHSINPIVRDNISAYVFEKIYNKSIDLSDFSKINISGIKSHIDDAIDKSYVLNSEDFLKQIRDIEKGLSNRDVYDKIRELYDKFNFDISYSSKDFSNNLFDIFKKNVDSIIRILSFQSFEFYIELIAEIDSENATEKREFLIEAGKKFIDSLKESDESLQNMLHGDFPTQFQNHEELLKYLEDKKKGHEESVTGDSDSLIELLNKPIIKRGWSQKDEEIISSVTTASHKKFMLESKEYLECAFKFSRWTKSFAGNKPFGHASDRIIEAMKQISNESSENEFKLRYIIKALE